MLKIIQPRGHGKTTELLKIAHEKNYIIVEPNIRMAKYADQLAGALGLKVRIITAHDLIDRYFHRLSEYRNCHYLIDELEMFLLEIARVEGYSDTVDQITLETPKVDIVGRTWGSIDHDPFVGAGW